MGLDGKPVDMYIKPDVGTFNQIIIRTPPGPPGNSPIKIPSTGEGAYEPGDPFVITSVDAVIYQYGTSCVNTAKWTVTVNYTGDPIGKTVSIDRNQERTSFVLWDGGFSPSASILVPQDAHWSKPNSLRYITFRAIDDSDGGNTADSDERSIEAAFCGF